MRLHSAYARQTRRMLLRPAGLLLATMLLPGCQTFGLTDQSDRATVVPQPKTHYAMPSIPVPEGFVLDEEHSQFLSTGANRCGMLEFTERQVVYRATRTTDTALT